METMLLEQRIHEIEDELGKRAFDDPVRKELVDQLSVLRKCLVDAEKAETDRLNMNQQYDKLELEEDRIKSENKRHKLDRAVDVGLNIIMILAGFSSMRMAWKFENLDDLLISRTAQNAWKWITGLSLRRR